MSGEVCYTQSIHYISIHDMCRLKNHPTFTQKSFRPSIKSNTSPKKTRQKQQQQMATLTPSSSSQPPTTQKLPTQKNLKSTIPNFISLLTKSSTTKELTQIHTQLVKSNSIQHPSILSKLLSLYSSLDLQSALQLFSSLSEPNSVHWNTLIHGFSLSPTPENSILMYIILVEDDPFCINAYTFPSVLKACGEISAGFEGTQIHSHAIKGGFVCDVYVENTLMQMCFGCGRSRDARKVFDGMTERNVVSWNCVVGGYAELGLWEDVVSLFKDMVGEGIVTPNSVTLVRVVTACCRLGDVETGKWVSWYVKVNGVLLCLNLGNALMNMYAKFGDMVEAQRLFDQMGEHDVVSWTTLVSGYASAGDLGLARKIFDEMPVRNKVTWNALIASYVQNCCFQEAILLYEKMLVHDVKTDKATLLSVLSACARSGDLFTGMVIHGYISKIGINMTDDLLHSILGLYSKCGDMNAAELLFNRLGFRNEIPWTLMVVGYVTCGAKEIALDLFEQMPCKDVTSWNALISTLSKCNHFNEALDVFEDMQKMEVTPNCLTFVSTLSACARVGDLELGKWIHAYIERNKIKMDAQLCSSIIDMYAKCGCIELSLDVFNRMSSKDLLAWSTMIGGLAMHGHSKLALELFRQMEDFGVQPDAITFVEVLSACSHAGLVEEGKYYFNLMTQTYGISPTTEHYGCMVDLFSRLGLLREAKDFIDRIRISSNEEAIWGALLGACNLHGNVELAEYATSRLLEVDPTSSGAYVLLSNTYAKASMWDKVGKLRYLMKGKGIEKVPGCSSIEVNGIVHEFFAGDASHPESGDIHMMLDGLEKLKEAI